MKKILLLIVFSFILYGCGNTNNMIDIKKIMDEKEYIIIDVRTEEEYRASHITGALNIPYDQINEKTKLDFDKVIFVYCKSGNRSKIAFDKLVSLGYEVYDLGAFSKIDLPKE